MTVPCETLLDQGDLPITQLARIAMREGVRPRAAYQSHKWFARRFAVTARSLLVAGATCVGGDFWKNFYQGDSWVGKSVLDPFVGGGVMLLEASRLGADVKGVDIEPVAAAISRFQTTLCDLPDLSEPLEKLANEVGGIMRRYYRTAEGQTLLHAFWVQTLVCGECEHKFDAHPTVRLAWDEANGRQWVVCRKCSEVHNVGLKASHVDCSCGVRTLVDERPVNHGVAQCPECGHQEKLIAYARRTQARPAFRMFAVETLASDKGRIATRDRTLRSATPFDLAVFEEARNHFDRLLADHPMSLPKGRIPKRGRSDNRLIDYGYADYADLFNVRQKLHLSLLGRAIARLPKTSRDAMAIAFSDHLTTNNMMCGYAGGWRRLTPLFSIRAYRHIGRPVEINPWLSKNGRGTFPNAVRSVIRAAGAMSDPHEPTVDGQLRAIADARPGGTEVICGDARKLAHIPTGTIDLVLTDPPYFDYISYSELGHFFTPWLRRFGLIERHAGKEFPVAQLASTARSADAERRFANRLGKAFKEIRRVCRDNGRVVFTYQNLDGRGWSAISKAMARAGVVPFRMFPLFGDSSASLHKTTQSISWDCVIVCRLSAPRLAAPLSPEDVKEGRRVAEAWRTKLAAEYLPITEGDIVNIGHAAAIVAASARCDSSAPDSLAAA